MSLLKFSSILLLISFASPTIADFIDHGVAAPVSRSRGATAAVDGDGKNVVIVWLFDHRQTTALLVIDADTGNTQQVEIDRRIVDSPFAVLHSTKNRFYSQFGGFFYEFDIETRSISFTGETPLRCAMSMYEDSEGLIWCAIYPDAHLVSFNPNTQELVDHGQFNVETWPQYPRSLAMDPEGWIYTGIGNTNAQVAGYNPETKEIVKFISEDNRKHGTGVVYKGLDGNVYGTAPEWGWHILLGGKAISVEGEPAARDTSMRTGNQASVFRDFPDGDRIDSLNIPDGFVIITDTDGNERRVDFEYQSEGSLVYSMVMARDGAIYGSTGHPLRVYRFDPQTGIFAHNPLVGGHLNAMAVQRGYVFGAAYTGGVLHQYDLDKPWRYLDENDPNPKRLGQSSPHIDRPHALVAHPDGRHMIMAGTPGYGHTGGGMFIYDLETDESQILTHEELIDNQSARALVVLPDGNLMGGTTIAPGTGGAVKASEAELFLFDFEKREIIWHEALIPDIRSYTDLILCPEGFVYGIAGDSTFFVFDPETRKFVHEENLSEQYGSPAGAQAPRIMAFDSDGKIYVLFQKAIITIEPRTYRHEKIADTPANAWAGIVIHEGRLYFGIGSHIWSYPIAN